MLKGILLGAKDTATTMVMGSAPPPATSLSRAYSIGQRIGSNLVVVALAGGLGVMLLGGHVGPEPNGSGQNVVVIIQILALLNVFPASGFGRTREETSTEGGRTAPVVPLSVPMAIAATLAAAHAGYPPTLFVGVLPALAGSVLPSRRPLVRGLVVVAALPLVGLVPGWLDWRAGVLTATPPSMHQATRDALLLTFAGILQVVLTASARAARRTEESRRQAERDAAASLQEQRRTIARDLHDVVAHQMAVVTERARAAVDLLPPGADRARGALGVIEDTSSASLVELTRLVAALGDADAAGPGMQPGLADVGPFLDRCRDGGAGIELEITGPTRPLPESVGVCVFRIVQEAVTNAMRHAAGSPVRVAVTYTVDGIELSVTDRGPQGSLPDVVSGGNGLVGMRERATLLGGEVEAGPAADASGWRVLARLPT